MASGSALSGVTIAALVAGFARPIPAAAQPTDPPSRPGQPGLRDPAAPGARELPDTRPPIEQLLARLDDPIFSVRERATFDLANRDDLTLGRAEQMLADPGLSPEQRLRLSAAALALFMRGPRPAMGISFALGGEPDAAVVEQPQAGFHAAEVLRHNDRVLEADGVPITDQPTFRALILSHAPGDTMPLKIMRDGAELEVEVRLGSFADLRTGAPRGGDLLSAWRMRRARGAGGAASDPIVPEAGARGPEARIPGRETPEWRAVFASPDAPDTLVIGGQARQSADLSLTELAGLDAARTRIVEAGARGQDDLELQVSWFRRQRSMAMEELAGLEARLLNEGLSPVERQSIVRDAARMEALIASTEQQIRALENAIRGDAPRP
ncbi:MAG TPA: PDZ domain-containing protein [Phycisphaerales bacterium]|nr:PDZ domain-containing protein [Phycisphaerales bacterium]